MEILPEDPNLSDTPELPYEYVNSKLPWKKIVIALGVVLIASIPFVLSLFHIKYLAPQSSELMETAYSQNQHSGVWGSFVTGVRYLIKAPLPTPTPVRSAPFTPASTTQSESQQDKTQSGYTTPSQNNQPLPTDVPDQGNYSPQNSEDKTYPTQTQDQYVYPYQESNVSPTQQSQPYNTPPPPPVQQQAQNPWYPTPTRIPTTTPNGCVGKKNNSECSYVSPNGHLTKGVCKMTFYGVLTC